MLDSVSAQAYRDAARQWRGKLVWQTLVASLVLLALFAGGIVLYLLGIVPIWVATITSFVAAHAGFTILHEASHRAISGDAPGLGWIDSALGTAHATLLLYDFQTFRFLHLRHHSHTNEPALDPDYWMQRHSIPMVLLLALFVPLHYLRQYLLAARAGVVSRAELTGALVRIGVLVTVLLTALVLFPVETFLLWLAPASVATALISLSHRMLHAAELSADRRQTTRIITGDRFWEWIICPLFWLNNHHLIHHETPRLPAISHPGLFRKVEGALAASGAKIVRLGKRAHE